LALALGLLAPSAGAAGWSEPRTVADPVDPGFQEAPAIVAGPHGQLAVAWSEHGGIGLAYARRGGSFGPPELVPHSAGGFEPALGIDATGNITIAWNAYYDCELEADEGQQCGSIHAAARLRDGRFTPARRLTRDETDTFWARISVAPDGRAAVWWGGLGNDGAGARVAPWPGRFGATELRDRDVQAWTFDRRGRAAQVVIENRHGLVALRRGPGGRLTGRHVLLKDERPHTFYAWGVGADRRGLQGVLWPAAGDLSVALRTPSGRFATQTLVRGVDGILTAALDTGPSGLTVVGWARRASDQSFDDYYYDYSEYEAAVRARVSLPGRRFGPPQLLAPRYRERPLEQVVASAGPRSALVAWRGVRPDGAQGIYAAHAGPHGHFARVHLLSADSTSPLSDPAVAVDQRDRATVAWFDGLSVRAARFR
jgi:hypothetical protein